MYPVTAFLCLLKGFNTRYHELDECMLMLIILCLTYRFIPRMDEGYEIVRLKWWL